VIQVSCRRDERGPAAGGRGGRGGGAPRTGVWARLSSTRRLAQSANMQFGSMHDPGLIEVTATLTKDQSLDNRPRRPFSRHSKTSSEKPAHSAVENLKAVRTQFAGGGLEKQFIEPAGPIATGALNSAIAQGDWRLMFLQHDRLSDVIFGRCGAGRESLSETGPIATVGYYIPDTETGSHDSARRTGILPKRSTTTRAPSRWRAAKRSTLSLQNIDSRIVRLEDSETACALRCCRKKSRQQHGDGIH